MERIDWLAEIGHQRPTEDRLWHAWKRVIGRIWGEREAAIGPQIRIWRGNFKRRTSERWPPPGRAEGGPWFANWPGWVELTGPYPDEPPLRDRLVAEWLLRHPDAKPYSLDQMTRPLTKSERFRILVRDRFTCRYCGAKAPTVRLDVDHVKPRSQGGSNDPSNLVTSCWPCNSGKSDTEVWTEDTP